MEGAGDDGGDTIQDMIAVAVQWDKDNERFKYTYYHYLPATLGTKNDVAFVGSALDNFMKDFAEDNPKSSPKRRLIIWSDGGVAHYKQQFALGMMLKKQIEWGISIEWNFWVPNHGHNVCDSAASVLKRTQRKVYAKDHKELKTPQEFRDFIENNLKSCHIPKLIEVYEHIVGFTSLHGVRLYHKFIFDSQKNIVSAYPSSLTTLEYKNVKRWNVERFKVCSASYMFIF